MSTTETKTMHFQISGADFTRIARERLLEDAPDHAWRIATSLLNDDDPADRSSGVADLALGILNGTKKLVGDTTNLRAVKEDAKVTKQFQKDLHHIYAGRIRIRGTWYRPVAYVTAMGPNDMKNWRGKPVTRRNDNRGFSNRAWHYCGENEIVVDEVSYPDPEFPAIKREVIFVACGERPHWLIGPVSPRDALDEFLKAGHDLEERSHNKWYGADDAPDNNTATDRTGARRASRADRTKRERNAASKGDLTPMNSRIAAELDLAQELDEDDRPEVQTLRDDPQQRSFAKLIAENPDEALRVFDDRMERDKIIDHAFEVGAGVGVVAQMLDDADPTALRQLAKTLTPEEAEGERLRQDLELAREIADPDAREEAFDQIEAEQEVLRKRRLVTLREEILRQANGDLIELAWDAVTHDDDSIRVPAGNIQIPRAPFMRWAFARMRMYENQLPPWQPISPVGVKMMNDDPNHTDWVIGGGLDPLDRALLYYPGPVNEAALKLAHVMQDRFDAPSPIHVLVDGPHALGFVHHGKRGKPCPPGSIVVLPDLRPQYLETIEDAAAVITEAGGMTAHLVQIGRERTLPIVRVEGALEKYEEGIELVVDTASRTVRGT